MPKQQPNGAASEDNSPVVFSVTEKQLTEILLRMQQDIKKLRRLVAETLAVADSAARGGVVDKPANAPSGGK